VTRRKHTNPIFKLHEDERYFPFYDFEFTEKLLWMNLWFTIHTI
jgi:hypothetical protein